MVYSQVTLIYWQRPLAEFATEPVGRKSNGVPRFIAIGRSLPGSFSLPFLGGGFILVMGRTFFLCPPVRVGWDNPTFEDIIQGRVQGSPVSRIRWIYY